MRDWGTRLLVVAALGAMLGCGATNGGGSGAVTEAVVAVDPVHLAPGVTATEVAWPASSGPVDNYLVFESRNGSPYGFNTLSTTPSVDITGAPGDSLQITVVAVSPNGTVSENSPPSPPIVFHAAETAAVVAQPLATASMPIATATAEEATAEEATAEESIDEPVDVAANEIDDVAAENEASAPEQDETDSRLAQSVREMLLRGDARLPERGLSAPAQSWLQGQVDREIAAGVSLAGTGRADADAVREIVWQDQAGQLFLSDGQTFLDADDLPATFHEALRLRATERFVGLADFDGDSRGDWILEDTATGEVWTIDGASEETTSPATPTLVETVLGGHGDFDGDGRAELLWIDADQRLALTRPSGNAPVLDTATAPEGFELLAIADLDGDGRDDLLGRDLDGGLILALAVDADEGHARLEWRDGTDASTDGLDLVATLDVDDDGSAEIAWLNGEALEIWSAEGGFETSWDL